MNHLGVFIFVIHLGFALAKPLGSASKCTSECGCMVNHGSLKYSYKPGTTYLYSYTGYSEVVLQGIQTPAESRLTWSADVALSWITPCKVAIEVSNPVVNEHHNDHIFTELLAAKPMFITFKEGVVTEVFPDVEDHPTGLNFKKGIISSIQNVLPLIESISNQTFVEVDVLGRCPTVYSVRDILVNWAVTKTKNHKDCIKQHDPFYANPVTAWWIQVPRMPIHDSTSKCLQLISKRRNITRQVQCTDENIIRTAPGKHMIARQGSTLTFKKAVPTKKTPEVHHKPQPSSLIFEVSPQPVTEEMVPKVEKLLKELAISLENGVSKETASQVSKMAGLLSRVPEISFRKILEDIRHGRYCKNYDRLEEVFLDAMSFIAKPGAIQVMVDEITSGKITSSRSLMYTLALHVFSNPSIDSIEAVLPLFSESNDAHVSPSMTLAAGSLVRKYCKLNSDCLVESPIKAIFKKLTNILESSCSSVPQKAMKTKVLAALKTVGNIANITHSAEQVVLKCLKLKSADVFIRVSAAQAYRQVSCHNQPTAELVDVTSDYSENTEVRIASYVAAIKCADYDQIDRIIRRLSEDHDVQVRSFILSHLHNLQRSDAPYLRGLRYNLTSFIIPNDYSQDMKRHSFDSDYSYYLPTFGIGGGVETSVIYTSDSYLPRQFQTNITLDLFKNVMNIGEFSLRMEDLERMLEVSFGPKSYFSNNSWAKIMEDIFKTALKFKQQIKRGNYEKDDLDSILKGSGRPELDTFIRIFGQEILFGSFAPNLERGMDMGEWLRNLIDFITNVLIQASDLDVNSARAFQINKEHFVPTAQGIPLQFKMVGTAVVTIKLQSDLSVQKSKVDAKPSTSFDLNGFAGYSFGVKSGLRTRVQILTAANNSLEINRHEDDMEMIIDIPKNLTLLNGTGSCYMMNKMPGRKDIKTAPKEHYPVAHMRKCSPSFINDTAGMETCVEITAPDFLRKDIFPLGDYKITLDVDKASDHKPLVRISGKLQMKDREKEVRMKLELPCSKVSLKGEMGMAYEGRSSSQSLLLFGERPQSLRKSVRFELKDMKIPRGQSIHFSTYYDEGKKIAHSEKVLDLHYGRSQTEAEMESKMDLMTDKSLAKYIKTNIHVDIATKLSRSSQYVPAQIDIRQFEMEVALPNTWNFTTFVRQRPVQGMPRMSYHIYSSTKTPYRELLFVNGSIETQGEFERMTHQCRTNMSVKALDKSFFYRSAIVWTRAEKQIFVMVGNKTAPIVPGNLFMLNATLSEQRPSTTYLANAEIQIPSMISTYKFEGSIHRNSSDDYHLRALTKMEDDTMYELEGYTSYIRKRGLFKKMSTINVTDFATSKKYTLGSEVNGKSKQGNFKVFMKSNNAPLFAVESEMELKEGDFSSAASISIPEMIEAKVEGIKTRSELYASLNGFMRPNTPNSQLIKTYTTILLDKKEIEAQYSCGAERLTKKIKMKANYDYNFEKKFGLIRGDVSEGRNKYKYLAKSQLGVLTNREIHDNFINVRLTKASMKEELILFDCHCHCTPNHVDTVTLVKYTPEDEAKSAFKMGSKFDLEMPNPPHQMSFMGNLTLDTESLKELTMNVNSSVDYRAADQRAMYKMKIMRGEQQEPMMQTHFEIDNNPHGLDGKILLSGSASEMNFTIRVDPKAQQEQMIADGAAILAFKIDNSGPYKLNLTKKIRNTEFYLSTANRPILVFKNYNHDDKWYAKLLTPLRETEVHYSTSPDSFSFQFYPDRNKTKSRYEVAGRSHYSRSFSDSKLGTDLKFSYPGSEKEFGIQANMDLGQSTSRGSLVLDIFEQSDAKVVVDVQMSTISKYNYKILADVKIPAHRDMPKVDIAMVLSPDLKTLKMFVRKSDNEPVSLKGALSFIRSTEKDSAFFAHFATPYKFYRLMSAIQFHELFQCQGASVNGTFVSPRGSYNFASAICAPGYIEFGAKNVSDEKMFLAKLGMKNPANFKAALDLVYNSSRAITLESARKVETSMNLYGHHEYVPKTPMFLVGANLWSPKIVSIDLYYNISGIKEYWESVIKPTLEGASLVSQDLITEVSRELKLEFPKILPKLMSELKEIKEKLLGELNAILESLGISWEEIEEKMKAFMEEFTKFVNKVLKKIWDFFKNRTQFEMNDIRDKIKECEKQLKHCLQACEQVIQEIWDHGLSAVADLPLLKSLVEEFKTSTIFNWWRHLIHTVEKLLNEDFRKFKECFDHWVSAIEDEFKSIFDGFMEIPMIKKIIKWIESWIHEDPDDESTLVEYLISKFYGIHFNNTNGFLTFQLPLRIPVASLSSAVSSIGYSLSRPRSYYRPKYSVFAQVSYSDRIVAQVKPHSVETFAGLEVPMIPSNCEILLMKVFEDEVRISKPKMDVVNIKVILSSGDNFEIILEEGNPPQIPVLKQSAKVVMPGATILKISHDKIRVEFKGMKIRINKDKLTVQLKANEPLKVEGLLATSESRSDSDTAKLMLKKAKDLFETYKIDRSCVIPNPLIYFDL